MGRSCRPVFAPLENPDRIPKTVCVTQTAGVTFGVNDLNVSIKIDLYYFIKDLQGTAVSNSHETLYFESTGDNFIGMSDGMFLR